MKLLNKKIRKSFDFVLSHLALIIVTTVFLFPLYWTVTTSLKPPNEYYRMPPSLFPEKPTIYHYYEAFIPWVLEHMEVAKKFWVEEAAGRANPITPQLGNSIVITLVSLTLSLAIGSPTAYALSRYKFRGSQNIAFWILSTRMIPPIVAIIPIFFLINKLRLVDTRPGLIIPYIMINLPFVVWMMKGFFDDIPLELEEVAKIDGCSAFQAFFKVTLPLSINGLVATALFCAFITWNEFMFALVLTRTNAQTLPVVLSRFRLDRGILWGMMSASVVVAIFPLIMITFFLQRQLVRGFTAGSLK